MTRMLLVQDDPVFRGVISRYLKKSNVLDKLEYALTGVLGARKIAAGRFDIAMINVTLPDTSGLELAELASNENISVLMLSEGPGISEELNRLAYRYLERPFSSDVLLAESKRVILERKRNICQVKTSAAMLHANLRALQAEVDDAHRRFDTIIAQLGYLKR